MLVLFVIICYLVVIPLSDNPEIDNSKSVLSKPFFYGVFYGGSY